jgi:uncharacterized coiled-coil protein SlyX
VADTLEGRLAFLQRQLHAISLSVAQAKARGDTAAVVTLRALYRKLLGDVEALKADALKAEAPSGFMLALSAFSDEAIRVGKDVGGVVLDTAAATVGVVRSLPVILMVALVLAAVVLVKIGPQLLGKGKR